MLSSIGRAHWRSSCALAWRCPCPSPPAIHFRFRVLHPANPLLCQSPCSPCIHLHYATSSVFGLAVTCTCQRQWQHQHQPGEPGGRGCGGQPSAQSWHFFSFTSLEMRLVSRLSWRAARLLCCWAALLSGYPNVMSCCQIKSTVVAGAVCLAGLPVNDHLLVCNLHTHTPTHASTLIHAQTCTLNQKK